MPADLDADIDSLRAQLAKACEELSALSNDEVVKFVEGVPPVSDAGNELLGAPAETWPRWIPLAVGLPPGVQQVVDIIKAPLQVIVGFLQFLAGLLEVIKILLLALGDIFYAIVLAVYEAVKALVTDILGTGAYMFFDVPGISSPGVSARELGFAPPLKSMFDAGYAGELPPPVQPDAFDGWAARFMASFDDPGDLQRPVLSEGATIEAVFIMVAVPTLDALAAVAYVIGKLLNIQAFLDLDIDWTDPDPDLAQVAAQSVAPDWKSVTLVDLIPPLKELEVLPEFLLRVLAGAKDILGALADLANAISNKVQTLLELADAIQRVIDALDALSSSGLFMLPVSSTTGVPGLVAGFLGAANRPSGGYVGGACFLAAGPGLGPAAMLWTMFGADFEDPMGSNAFLGSLAAAGEEFDEAGAEIKSDWETFDKGAEETWKETENLVENFGAETEAYAEQWAEMQTLYDDNPEEFWQMLDDLQEGFWDDENETLKALIEAKARIDTLRRGEDLVLAEYLGSQPDDEVVAEEDTVPPEFEDPE